MLFCAGCGTRIGAAGNTNVPSGSSRHILNPTTSSSTPPRPTAAVNPAPQYASPPTTYPKKKSKKGLIAGVAAALVCVLAIITVIILGNSLTHRLPNSGIADSSSDKLNNNPTSNDSETDFQTGVTLSDEVFSMYPDYTCKMDKYDSGINEFNFSVPTGSYKYDIPSGNENLFESSFIVALYNGSQIVDNISSLTLDEIKNYQNSESVVVGSVTYGKRDELNKLLLDYFNSSYNESYSSVEEAIADMVEEGDFENPSAVLNNIDMIDVYLMDLLADGTSVYDTESILIANDGQTHLVNEEYLKEKWSNDGKTMSIEAESFSYDMNSELISSKSDIALIKRIDEGEYVKLFIGSASSWPTDQTDAVSQLEYTAKNFQ